MKIGAHRSHASSGPDSFEFWEALVRGLHSAGVARVGLFVHGYSGGIEDEAFSVVRREAHGDLRTGLEAMREDELVIFDRA